MDEDSSWLVLPKGPKSTSATDLKAEFDPRKEIQTLLAIQPKWNGFAKGQNLQQLGQSVDGHQTKTSLPPPKRLCRTTKKKIPFLD